MPLHVSILKSSSGSTFSSLLKLYVKRLRNTGLKLFTLKHLKCPYMFRSLDNPEGAHLVPCWSYMLKGWETMIWNFYIKTLKMPLHVSILRSSSGSTFSSLLKLYVKRLRNTDLKLFTLKHLKCPYMFRSLDHPQGAHLVPC